MARSVTKTTTPAELQEIVDETIKVLKDSGLGYDEKTVYAQFEQMAADLNEMSVEDWRAQWSTPAPAPAEPEPPKAPKKRSTKAVAVDPNYFWVDPKDQAFVELWMKQPAGFAHLLDTGPTGQGKTEKFKVLGQRLGIPVYIVNCPAITTPEDWIGHKDVVADEHGTRTEYRLSQHLKWVGGIDCEPGIVLYDEGNRLHPSLTNVLFSLLDRQRKVFIPELGIYAEVHPDTKFAMTANVGAGFQGTYPLDEALARRFGYRLETGVPPENEEVAILVNRTGIDEEDAKKLVQVARMVRTRVPTDLDHPISTANLLDTAVLVTAGMSILEAAEYTFVRTYADEGGATQNPRTIVRQYLSGKIGTK